jgi:putative addiction module killer protein
MTSTFTPGQNATRVFTLAAALPAGQGCEHAGVLEYRIDFGPGYRIYFGKDGDALVILLGGGTKKGQQHDIAAAHARWKGYKQRKSQEN